MRFSPSQYTPNILHTILTRSRFFPVFTTHFFIRIKVTGTANAKLNPSNYNVKSKINLEYPHPTFVA